VPGKLFGIHPTDWRLALGFLFDRGEGILPGREQTMMYRLISASMVALLSCVVATAPTSAVAGAKVGLLQCDVSAGIGMIIMQKQTMRCTFKPDNGGPPDLYTGRIDEFGVAIGEVAAGHLIWGVLASDAGVPKGALAGSYAGAGAEATVGAGMGANILVGGTGRAFSLQPLSVEGQTGLNIAGGITTVTLVAVQ
jgi:hypothetical protein